MALWHDIHVCDSRIELVKAGDFSPFSPGLACSAEHARARLPRFHRLYWACFSAPLLGLLIVLTGCGGATLKIPSSTSGTGTLLASPGNVSFGSVSVGNTITSSVDLVNQGSAPVNISQMAVTGQTFSINWTNDLPITVAAGGTYHVNLGFAPTSPGAASGQLTVTSDSAATGTLIIGLNGNGTAVTSSTPGLAAFTCASSSATGAGTDACTLTLSAAAPTGGFVVSLSSNNAALTVPASVLIPAGSTSAMFTATMTSVTATQTATITATTGGSSRTFTIQLNPATAVLSFNASSLAFGSVNLNTTATQSITLTSSGALPVTISSAVVTGTGFYLVGGVAFPAVLNPGQSITLNVQFAPTVAGAVTGVLTIVSNSITNPTAIIGLTGTGVTISHEVDLAWTASSNVPSVVVGYYVFRAPSGTGSYQQLNASLIAQLWYIDTAVQSGQTYDYFVESIDATGITSSPSNVVTLAIP